MCDPLTRLQLELGDTDITKELQLVHESLILGSAQEDGGATAMLRKNQRPAGLANLGHEGCNVRAERSQRLNILGRFHAGHVGHLSVRYQVRLHVQ